MSCLFKYLGIFIVLMPFYSFGQKSVNGVILNYATEVRIDGAEVINLNTQKVYVSNGLGLFTVLGSVGDTLRVIKTGFNEQNIVISSEDDIIVRLKGITELEAVNVYGTTKEQAMTDAMKDYRKQGSYYNGKPPVLAYIFSPISALHETFGKTGKRAKRFQSYLNYEQDELLIDRKFNKAFVASLTGLEEPELTNFRLAYRPSYETVRYWNEYDARTYVKKAYTQYEKHGIPPTSTLPKIEIPELSKEQ